MSSNEQPKNTDVYFSKKPAIHFFYKEHIHIPPLKEKDIFTKKSVFEKANWGAFTGDQTEAASEEAVQALKDANIVGIAMRWIRNHYLFQEVAIGNLSNITSLNIPCNRLVSCEFLANMNTPKLQVLDLSVNLLTSVKSLTKMDLRSLKRLKIQSNFFVDLSVLPRMNSSNLKYINFQCPQEAEPRYRSKPRKYPVVQDLHWLATVIMKRDYCQKQDLFSENTQRIDPWNFMSNVSRRWSRYKFRK